MLRIGNCNLIKTCNACPEQYDVFLKEEIVGYIRLRWGELTVDYPDVGGEQVYSAKIGDSMDGMFMDEESRKYHLIMAVNVIEIKHKEVMSKKAR